MATTPYSGPPVHDNEFFYKPGTLSEMRRQAADWLAHHGKGRKGSARGKRGVAPKSLHTSRLSTSVADPWKRHGTGRGQV